MSHYTKVIAAEIEKCRHIIPDYYERELAKQEFRDIICTEILPVCLYQKEKVNALYERYVTGTMKERILAEKEIKEDFLSRGESDFNPKRFNSKIVRIPCI